MMKMIRKMNAGICTSIVVFSGILFATNRCVGLSRRQITSYLLDSNRYDANIVPDFDEDFPTNVTIQLTIHEMHSISETSMEYSIDVYLRMWWWDPRLDFSANSTSATKLELDSKNIDNVWQPDIFFQNEKRANIHTVTTINKMMHILRNGTVVYNIRLSLTLGCTMMLQYYPFDSQKCSIEIQSFGYTNDNIKLHWQKGNGIITEQFEMPQFTLIDDEIVTSDYENQYSDTGTFSVLKADLVMTRKVGFYFLQVFIPSILLVVLSWVSFWVDANAVPARVSLGVTCVLTMTTQSSGIRQSLPPVSYVKAIDIWMFVCLLFVFAALLEFAYVNVLQRKKSKTDNSSKSENIEDENNTKFANKNGTDGQTTAKRADMISRVLFPLSFIIFLLIFFCFYVLAPQPKPE